MGDILIYVMAGFALLGAIDRVLGCRLGLGEEFEKGILTMGTLALSMLGIIALAPVLASVLRPVVVPVFTFLGADPAMFAGTILACDMGGAVLAQQLSSNPEVAVLGGLITGSMLGATLVFTIPVAMGILQPEDRPFFAKGVLYGIVTIPVGILAGGLTAGISLGLVLRNLVPVVLLGAVVALGLWKWEKAMLRGFVGFGKGVVALVTLGLGLAILKSLTGLSLLPGLGDLSEGYLTVGAIAVVLAGAFPLVKVVTRVLQKPLAFVGRKLGVNDQAAAGFVATLANSVATLDKVKQMDNRGKVLNIAFAVSASFAFGDHLGFAASFAPQYLLPVIVGKLAGGISAVLLASALTRKDCS